MAVLRVGDPAAAYDPGLTRGILLPAPLGTRRDNVSGREGPRAAEGSRLVSSGDHSKIPQAGGFNNRN